MKSSYINSLFLSESIKILSILHLDVNVGGLDSELSNGSIEIQTQYAQVRRPLTPQNGEFDLLPHLAQISFANLLSSFSPSSNRSHWHAGDRRSKRIHKCYLGEVRKQVESANIIWARCTFDGKRVKVFWL